MSTINISHENPIVQEASSLLQKLSIFSQSQQSQSQQSQQSQVKSLFESNEDEKEDENDSDYEINEEEEEEAHEQEERDDKFLDEICVPNEHEPKQGLGSDEVVDLNKELNEALDVVKNVATKQKEIIINKIMDNYKQENGEEISSQNIQHAFKLLKMQIEKDEDVEDLDANQQDDDDVDEELDSSSEDIEEDELQEVDELQEDEYEDEHEDEQEENEVSEFDDNEVESLSPQAQEGLGEEIEEAMQIASELGKQAREQLTEKYYETFVEINGQEPSQEQINSIFQRVQQQLSEEAEEELFDDCDDTYGDDSVDVTSTLLWELSNWSDEDKKELIEEAQSIIPQETQQEAKQQWSNSSGREPNEQEFQNIIITLAQTKFTDEFFGKSDDGKSHSLDDDYDPEQDSQADEQDDDLSSVQDGQDELENLKQEIGNEILQKTIQSFEKKFGRSPNFEEQLINIENLFSSDKVQKLCDEPIENGNDDDQDNKE